MKVDDDFVEDDDEDFDEQFTFNEEPLSFKLLEVQVEALNKKVITKKGQKSPNQMTDEEFKKSYLNYLQD